MGNSKKLIVGSAVFAFVVWGAWAYFVNLNKGDPGLALRSAITQAFYSAIMTVYMSLSVLFLAKKTATWKLRELWPTIGTAGHTGTALIIVHTVNQTPALLKTVSLPILVSIIYCAVLTKKHYSK